MAPFLLSLIIFGVAARTNASPYPGDILGDDEEGYDVDIALSEFCHQVFTDNEPKYDAGFVNFMIVSICPLLLDDYAEGSGEGSVYWSGSGLQILTIQDIVQALSPDPSDRQFLRGMAESTCESEFQGHGGIDSFCRFRRDGIKVSGVDGGGGIGSGSGDGNGDGSGDGGYGFSSYWGSYNLGSLW